MGSASSVAAAARASPSTRRLACHCRWAYGGYLCSSRSVCELVRNRARSFVYSTGLPPGTVAAAAKALEIIGTDAERVRRPLQLARRFTAALGLAAAESAIVPIVFGSNDAALGASAALRQSGILVAAIRPPTVPTGTARLRFTFSALHTDAQVAALIAAVRQLDATSPRRRGSAR
jgi:8-amino-7-oxononanoate synthase